MTQEERRVDQGFRLPRGERVPGHRRQPAGEHRQSKRSNHNGRVASERTASRPCVRRSSYLDSLGDFGEQLTIELDPGEALDALVAVATSLIKSNTPNGH